MKKHKSKRVLSLFSGCGGMDLGFEGDFDVLRRCVNEHFHDDWIQKIHNKKWIRLKPTCFKTVFANDIRKGAFAAWVPFFRNKGLENADKIFHPPEYRATPIGHCMNPLQLIKTDNVLKDTSTKDRY